MAGSRLDRHISMDNKDAIINIPKDSQFETYLPNASHQKRFLKRFATASNIAKVSHTYHDIARKLRHLTPEQLLNQVITNLSVKQPALITYFDPYWQEALDFAIYVLAKVNLPAEAQRTIKQKQHEKYVKENMATKKPTPKQVSMLRYLGYEGQVQTRLEASELISKLKGSANEPGT